MTDDQLYDLIMLVREFVPFLLLAGGLSVVEWRIRMVARRDGRAIEELQREIADLRRVDRWQRQDINGLEGRERTHELIPKEPEVSPNRILVPGSATSVPKLAAPVGRGSGGATPAAIPAVRNT